MKLRRTAIVPVVFVREEEDDEPIKVEQATLSGKPFQLGKRERAFVVKSRPFRLRSKQSAFRLQRRCPSRQPADTLNGKRVELDDLRDDCYYFWSPYIHSGGGVVGHYLRGATGRFIKDNFDENFGGTELDRKGKPVAAVKSKKSKLAKQWLPLVGTVTDETLTNKVASLPSTNPNSAMCYLPTGRVEFLQEYSAAWLAHKDGGKRLGIEDKGWLLHPFAE